MEIENFTRRETLKIEGAFHRGTVNAALVSITQYASSMSFYFHLTPDQAREMADILNLEANRAESAEEAHV